MKILRAIAAIVDFGLIYTCYFILCGIFFPLGQLGTYISTLIMYIFVIYMYGFEKGVGNLLFGITIDKNLKWYDNLLRYPITLFFLVQALVGLYLPTLVTMFNENGIVIFLFINFVLIFMLVTYVILFVMNRDFWNLFYKTHYIKIYREKL